MSFQLKKATGCSSPASSTWVRTVPTHLSEANSNTKGGLTSGLLSTWFDSNIVFNFLKVVSHSSDHLYRLLFMCQIHDGSNYYCKVRDKPAIGATILGTQDKECIIHKGEM